jgi:hypothetical protein
VTQGNAAVSFLYRSLDIVPVAVAQEVQVEDMPPMTVVSVGVRGGYDYSIYTSGLQQLQGWLAHHPDYEVAGPPGASSTMAPMCPIR